MIVKSEQSTKHVTFPCKAVLVVNALNKAAQPFHIQDKYIEHTNRYGYTKERLVTLVVCQNHELANGPL